MAVIRPKAPVRCQKIHGFKHTAIRRGGNGGVRIVLYKRKKKMPKISKNMPLPVRIDDFLDIIKKGAV